MKTWKRSSYERRQIEHSGMAARYTGEVGRGQRASPDLADGFSTLCGLFFRRGVPSFFATMRRWVGGG